MEKTTYIKDIQEGLKGFKPQNGVDVPWTKYTIIDIDNVYYADFDHILQLGPAFENQVEVTLTYTETPSKKMNQKTNQPYINRTIKSVKVAQSIPAELERRVKRLEQAISEAGIPIPKE